MILLDMDGTLVDFVSAACKTHGKDVGDVDCWNFFEKWGMTADEFWAPINAAGREWWANLEPYPWAGELLSIVCEADPNFHICTTPSRIADCLAGKLDWIHRWLGDDFRRYIFTPNKALCAGPGSILIDDSDDNCGAFFDAGGQYCLLPQPWNCNRRATPGDLSELLNMLAPSRRANVLGGAA